MSVILVTFPAAPAVNEEAVLKDQEVSYVTFFVHVTDSGPVAAPGNYRN